MTDAANPTIDTPTEVEITLGDKKVKVSPDVAAALTTATKSALEAGETAASLKSQIAELTSKVTAAEEKAKPAATGEQPLSVQLFVDPDAAVARITQTILQQVSESSAKANAQADFWREFYKSNKDLEEFDGYVKFVFGRDFESMKKAGLTVGDAIKKLGETVKGDVMKMSKKGGSQKPVGEGGNERGNSGGGEASKTESEDSPNINLTGSILAERKAARQAAKQPGRKK